VALKHDACFRFVLGFKKLVFIRMQGLQGLKVFHRLNHLLAAGKEQVLATIPALIAGACSHGVLTFFNHFFIGKQTVP
jgi:hypothetical protein